MMYMMYNEELFELPVKRLSRYRKGAPYDKRSYPDYDHSVWFAFREHELVGAWTQSPSRAVACAFLSALEAGRVGVTDQFRPPPGPDHRLCSTRSHPPRHQDRVLYRRAGGGNAIRSLAHPLSQGQRRHVHDADGGLDRGDTHRRASRAVSYRLCCGTWGAVHTGLGCRLAAARLHTPTPVHR